MTRPIVNLADVVLTDHHQGDRYQARFASLAPLIGARKLGARLCVLPPGKAAWPFHAHLVNEEMVVILEGAGSLRLGAERHPIKAGDVIALVAGSADSAHQIINDSRADLRYLALSTMEQPEVCLYPDTDKFGVLVGTAPGSKTGNRDFEFFGYRKDARGYWDGED
ncbi:MAG TPA: cupin domain-containing protein [Rhodocyclaceae bacterium]|jgi:uncharacterized cupin superfamily protein